MFPRYIFFPTLGTILLSNYRGNIIIEIFKTFKDFWTQLRPFPLLTFNTVRREVQDLNAPVLFFLQSASLMPSELVCNSLHNMRQDRDTLECPGQKYISRLIKGLVFGHYCWSFLSQEGTKDLSAVCPLLSFFSSFGIFKRSSISFKFIVMVEKGFKKIKWLCCPCIERQVRYLT